MKIEPVRSFPPRRGLCLIAAALILVSSSPSLFATCTNPPADLAAWWMAEGNARDSIGSNHGSLDNATLAAGQVGQAFQFDGVDDYVSINNLPELQNATGFTVLAWINKTDEANYSAGYVGKWDTYGSPNNTFLLYNGEAGQQGRGGFVIQFDDNSVGGVSASTIIPTNQWVLVAATWRSSDGQIVIYKNGTADGFSSGGAGRTLKYHTAYWAAIGQWGVLQPQQFRFKGRIDEPMIFRRALTQAEIQSIYNAGVDGLCQSGLSTVTNLNDAGLGSLRAAINYTNAHAGADVIRFTNTLTGVIGLTSGDLDIRDDLKIVGPSARLLAVSGQSASGVFFLALDARVDISGLTIRDGLTANGAGIIVSGRARLTMSDCNISSNVGRSENFVTEGGGMAVYGFLDAQRCTFSDNRAEGKNANGGDLYVDHAGDALLSN